MPVVLVVEDDSELLQVLTDALADEGWLALGAGSGAEALQIARSRGVDVVLADLLLPGGNGLELERKFQAIPTLANIPFVFMTGSLTEVSKIGPRPVLLKPFSLHQATAALAASLDREDAVVASCGH